MTRGILFCCEGKWFLPHMQEISRWTIFALPFFFFFAWIQRKMFLDKSKLAGHMCLQKYSLLLHKRCLLWMLWFPVSMYFIYFETSWNKKKIISNVMPVGNSRCYADCGPFQSTLSNGCNRESWGGGWVLGLLWSLSLSLRLLVLCDLRQVALPLWMTISFLIEDKCSTA